MCAVGATYVPTKFWQWVHYSRPSEKMSFEGGLLNQKSSKIREQLILKIVRI